MKTEVSICDVEGKTVTTIVCQPYGRQAVIVFADNTFATLEIDRGYEVGDESITGGDLAWLDFGDSDLVNAGVATQEELDKLRADRDALLREVNTERDRQLFERLKKQFGG